MLQDVLSFKQLYRGKCPKKVINPNSIISANDSDWKFLIVSSAVYPRENDRSRTLSFIARVTRYDFLVPLGLTVAVANYAICSASWPVWIHGIFCFPASTYPQRLCLKHHIEK